MATEKKGKHVTATNKQREETSEQKQAFETYFMMGDDRSYRKLAKMLNKGVSTMANWSRWFEWQIRVERRERQVGDIVEEKNNKTMAEIKMEQARLIDATMNRFWEKVRKGSIELESWQDYERLWKIRAEIGGESEKKTSSMFTQLSQAISEGVSNMNKEDDTE